MRNRLMAAALVLGLAACSSPPSESADSTDPETLSVGLMDFMLEPDGLEATGPSVTFDATSDGPTPHNLTIRDADGEVVAATADLSAGESETISAELEPGEYTIFCSLAGHESLGMSGTLTVTGP